MQKMESDVSIETNETELYILDDFDYLAQELIEKLKIKNKNNTSEKKLEMLLQHLLFFKNHLSEQQRDEDAEFILTKFARKAQGDVVRSAVNNLISLYDVKCKTSINNNLTREALYNAFNNAMSEYNSTTVRIENFSPEARITTLISGLIFLFAFKDAVQNAKNCERKNMLIGNGSMYLLLIHMPGGIHSFQCFKIIFIKHLIGAEQFARLAIKQKWQPENIYIEGVKLLKNQHISLYEAHEKKMASFLENKAICLNEFYKDANKKFLDQSMQNAINKKFASFFSTSSNRNFNIDNGSCLNIQKAITQFLFVEHGKIDAPGALKVIFIQELLEKAGINFDLTSKEQVTWFFCYLMKDQVKKWISSHNLAKGLVNYGVEINAALNEKITKVSMTDPTLGASMSIHDLFIAKQEDLELEDKIKIAQKIMKTCIKNFMQENEIKFDEEKIIKRIERLDANISFHFLVEASWEVQYPKVEQGLKFGM